MAPSRKQAGLQSGEGFPEEVKRGDHTARHQARQLAAKVEEEMKEEEDLEQAREAEDWGARGSQPCFRPWPGRATRGGARWRSEKDPVGQNRSRNDRISVHGAAGEPNVLNMLSASGVQHGSAWDGRPGCSKRTLGVCPLDETSKMCTES